MSEEIRAMAAAAVERQAFGEAIALLRPLAESGDRDAQFALGFLVLTECDELTGREGFRWLKAAADRGHPEAAYHVATFPPFASEGFSSPLTADESWRFLTQAAEAGSVEAQHHAAACLATGDWGEEARPPAPAEALHWYRRAAESGNSSAQFNLACMLLEGEGCEPDRAEGIRWLRRAAASGDSQAPRYLVHLGEAEQGEVEHS
jgi:TPR repeat protein